MKTAVASKLGTKRIAIIEDEPVLLHALDVKIKSAGYRTLTADDGSSGLKLVMDERPDLVVLDIVLPQLSGYDILSAAKRNPATSGIPVLILSNYGHEEEVRRGMSLGATAYLIKSTTSLDQLLQAIRRQLEPAA